MNWLYMLFRRVMDLFSSDKRRATLDAISAAVTLALPIVTRIAELTGNTGEAATFDVIK